MQVAFHAFERVIRLDNHRALREYFDPMQMAFIVSERGHHGRRAALASHEWVLGSLCRSMMPTAVALVEAGCVPHATALARMLDALDSNPRLGAVCGRHVLGTRDTLCSPVIAAQAFSQGILGASAADFNSLCGRMPLLDERLSVYRYSAVAQPRVMDEFLRASDASLRDLGPVRANTYARFVFLLHERLW